MDLKTTYLGLELECPLMGGASPLTYDVDGARRLEDAGAGAITLHSLFEEQIRREQLFLEQSTEPSAESSGEALSYFPDLPGLKVGPEEYLELVQQIKKAVSVPVIASLNGDTPGGWTGYARKIEEAGADALELNVYFLGAGFEESGETVEQRTLQVLEEVKRSLTIPVAVKLGPFYSSMANLARRLDQAGADGLVLFNRFFQPDIDVESLEVVPRHGLSTSAELNLRLRWLALLSRRIRPSLAVTGGVHTALDAVKAIMAGAHAVQLVSALLKGGPGRLAELRRELISWLEEHEYASVRQLQGSMSLESCPNPAALTRANYMEIIKSWKPEMV